MVSGNVFYGVRPLGGGVCREHTHTHTHTWQPVLSLSHTWRPDLQEPLANLQEPLEVPDQRLLEALSQQDGLTNSDQVGLDLQEPLVVPDQRLLEALSQLATSSDEVDLDT